MWFFILLLFVGAIFKFGDPFFYFCLFMILLFFTNWLLNKLFQPEGMGDRERAVFAIIKAIVFILLWFWFW
ncbi:MAG: hypothetical protein BHV96_03845 [Clostridium sp. CAG:354_28_25]|nr:MAG: hypothetical protein BHV96_03845 [Clostridium sp. CAG:354_28_25]